MIIVCFKIDEQRFALPVASVERVIMAQTITLIPDSPGILQGVIDYYGDIIAVINLRNRFHLPDRPIRLSDRFIITVMPGRKLALAVDEVEGVLDQTDEDANHIIETDFGLTVASIQRDDKGIILIYDLEKLITSNESIEIKEIVKRAETSEV